MDGRSIVPLVTGKMESLDRPWRTHFMTEFAEGGFQQWGTNHMWDYDPHGKVVDANVAPPWGPGCATRNACANNSCTQSDQCPTDPRHDYQYEHPPLDPGLWVYFLGLFLTCMFPEQVRRPVLQLARAARDERNARLHLRSV